MVRNYKRKTNRGSYSKDNLQAAVLAVRNGTLSGNKAAALYKIPRMTIMDYVNNKRKKVIQIDTSPNSTSEIPEKDCTMTPGDIKREIDSEDELLLETDNLEQHIHLEKRRFSLEPSGRSDPLATSSGSGMVSPPKLSPNATTIPGDIKSETDFENDLLMDGDHAEQYKYLKRRRFSLEPSRESDHLASSNASFVVPKLSPVASRHFEIEPMLVSRSPENLHGTPMLTIQDDAHYCERSLGSSSRIASPLDCAFYDCAIANNLHTGSEAEFDIDDDEDQDDVLLRVNRRRLIPFDGTYDGNIISELNFSAITPLCPKNANEGHIYGPSNKFQFNWTPFQSISIDPALRREQFSEPVGPIHSYQSSYEAFTAIWDEDIMQLVATETNKYASQLLDEKTKANELQNRSRIKNWVDTTVNELYVFFGILMGMSLCFKVKIKEYWINTGSITDTPNFSVYMPYNRFVLLCKCLHFRDNTELLNLLVNNQIAETDFKLQKIKPIIDHLNDKFQKLYNLSRDIVIDESLVQCKDQNQIKQFIKNKGTATGIKSFELCDSKNGYLWRFALYTGSENRVACTFPLEEKIPSLVLRLLHGLEHTHRTVWMDKFYNSPSLARHLKSVGLDCAGTLSINQQFVPDELKYLEKSEMLPGGIDGYTSGDVDLLVWRDKNRIAMISTYHGIAVSTKEKKPAVVVDYNFCMGGVDRKDQLLSKYSTERKRMLNWYKKFFRRLLNVSIMNSYILYNKNETVINIEHYDFRRDLMDSLLIRHGLQRPTLEPFSPLQAAFPNARLITTIVPIFGEMIVKHFPKWYPLYPGKKGERRRKSCIVCHRRTQYFCPGCNVALCAFSKTDDLPCFITHHN